MEYVGTPFTWNDLIITTEEREKEREREREREREILHPVSVVGDVGTLLTCDVIMT